MGYNPNTDGGEGKPNRLMEVIGWAALLCLIFWLPMKYYHVEYEEQGPVYWLPQIITVHAGTNESVKIMSGDDVLLTLPKSKTAVITNYSWGIKEVK